jgi:hypothetical protein
LGLKGKASDMEMTAVVLHEGALAHYDVEIGEDGRCYAYLQKYSGRPENMPPRQLVLRKERRHWVADDNYSDLSDELGYAIELKAKPLLTDRSRGSGHPAG